MLLSSCKVCRLGSTADNGAIKSCTAQAICLSLGQEGFSSREVVSVGGAGQKTPVRDLILSRVWSQEKA